MNEQAVSAHRDGDIGRIRPPWISPPRQGLAIELPPETAAAGEAALVARLRAGDEAAFEYLVRTHSSRLLRVAGRILQSPDGARDAVQDTFLQAFHSIDRFHGHARLTTWLHRIVVNAALMRLRSRKRKPEESIDELLPHFRDDGHYEVQPRAWQESAEETMQRAEMRALVRRRVNELPEPFRNVLLLRDIEELDTEETAQLLGISTNAVRVRLHRARLALRTLLDPDLRKESA